jgi:hypothetical protein
MQPVEREIDGGFLFGRKMGQEAEHSTDGKAGARIRYTVDVQNVRGSYLCPRRCHPCYSNNSRPLPWGAPGRGAQGD